MLLGAWHTGIVAPAPLVGNARAVLCKVLLTCAGVSAGLTDSIKPAVPATSGAEKLVPSDNLKLSL